MPHHRTTSRFLHEADRNVSADGSLDIADAVEDTRTCKQFEAGRGQISLNCILALVSVFESDRHAVYNRAGDLQSFTTCACAEALSKVLDVENSACCGVFTGVMVRLTA